MGLDQGAELSVPLPVRWIGGGHVDYLPVPDLVRGFGLDEAVVDVR